MEKIVFVLGSCAASIVVLVGVSVFRNPQPHAEQKFPWFWVFFPLTVFSLIGLGGSLISYTTTSFDYGWTMYSPLSDPFDVPIWAAFPFDLVLILIGAVGGVIGAILSWRRGRI